MIDGFHRLKALKELGKEFAEVELIKTDNPFLESVKRNLLHGVPLTKRERNKVIVKLYRESNMTQQEIADLFDLSVARISQLLGILVSKDTVNYLPPYFQYLCSVLKS